MAFSRPSAPVAAILAGGNARRLDGAVKATLTVAGRTLLSRLRETLGPQAPATLLCVTPQQSDLDWARESGLPVATDPVADRGPLSGVAAALAWAKRHTPEADTVVTVPVDTPFVPADLVRRLAAAAADAPSDAVVIAESATRRHHAVALWPVALAEAMMNDVRTSSDKAWSLHGWQARRLTISVPWHAEPFDPFFNINTADDLRAAERIAVLADASPARRLA